MTKPDAVFDAEAAFSGTAPPEGADRLDEARLADWLRGNVPGFAGPMTLAKFRGGQSNPTYRIDTPERSYVLRRKPFGILLPSAHAVDREFRVQSALARTGFPVAPQYGLCTDDDVIGSWFYVMELMEGRTIWNGAMPGATPQFRRDTYNAMIDTLAALHNVDISAAGLTDYGKPGNYFQRQVDRWTRQYRLSETSRIEEMERLIAWLPQTLPVQERTSVVHGDFRIDNMIWAQDRPEIRAVLDWELSTLGDPLADFTYFAVAWVANNDGRSGVGDLDRKALGIPELEEAVARYCAATGRPGLAHMNWYFAYNFFRMAGITQGIRKRVIDGTATSAQARAMSERVDLHAARAWAFALKAGA